MTDNITDEDLDRFAWYENAPRNIPSAVARADVAALVAALRSERTQQREPERDRDIAYVNVESMQDAVFAGRAELERERTQNRELRAPVDAARWRREASRAVEAIDERYFSAASLESQIKTFAAYIYDLTDERVFLDRVAHAAFHLIDDSGESEVEKPDDHGDPIHIYFHSDHERLSDALDAAEANGWDAHPAGSSQEAPKA